MIELKHPFILASGSPRRKEILETMGIPFSIDVSEVDESFSGTPEEAVSELSCRKAKAVAQRYLDAYVLAADTLVYADHILGKPGTKENAVNMLRELSLKIVAVTPVFGYDGTADMKYALVSRTCSYPSLAEGDDRYLELRLAADDKSALPELVLALGDFDTEIHRINSVFFDTEEGREEYYSLILKKEGGDFSMILTYLTLFVPTHTVVGLYKNLEL